MADTITAQIQLSAQWSWLSPQGDGSIPKDVGTLSYPLIFTAGTSDNQSSKMWHQTLSSIASAGTVDLDLTNLTNTIFGATVTTNFSKVRLLVIQNLASTPGEDLQLVVSPSNGWYGTNQPFAASTDTLKILAGGTLILPAPYNGFTVDGTHKVLRIKNNGAAGNTPNVLIIGN